MNRPIAALIACVKSKNKKPMKAEDLYCSDLFLKSKKFAKQKGCKIYILSAKYGLIPGDKVIVPYEQTLNAMAKDQIDKWADDVATAINMTFSKTDTLLVMAGSKYLAFLAKIQNPIIDPMKGLSIGRRLQWLKHHTK